MGPLSALLLVVALVCTFVAARYLAYRGCSLASGGRAQIKASANRLLRLMALQVRRCQPVERAIVRVQQAKRAAALRAAMLEMLRLLCMALEAGSSLPKALEYAADNCEEPLSSELRHAVWDLKSGQGFDEAMGKLRERTGGTEISHLVVAMEIQHRTGGSLSNVLSAVADSLQKADELENTLQTQTAQGRLSARVVALMPLVILGMLLVVSPGYLAAFFSSPLGLLMFGFAVVLEAAGVVLVRRVLDIDLSGGALEGT